MDRRFYCYHCEFYSKFKDSLKKHIMRHFSNPRPLRSFNEKYSCPVCPNYKSDRQVMINHYTTVHDARFETMDLEFSSFEKFTSWKDSIEKQETSKYVKFRSPRKCKTFSAVTYYCHREGFFKPRGKNKRNSKFQGSNKINSCCPATMNVKFFPDGTVSVKFVSGHFGHENEVVRLTLSKQERLMIAEKLSNNMPLDMVLDSIRESSMSNNECDRIRLATKRDLRNIARDFNLNSDIVKHNMFDATNVQSWVEEISTVSNAVRFYKAQHSAHPELEDNDFVLIISNAAQLELLDELADEFVCFNGTHSLSQHAFELTTLSVIDEHNQGFPGAFMISNRSDIDIMTLFINVLKDAVGRDIITSTFMSDVSDVYYDAWCRVMPPPNIRLFCGWHVHHEWRKNLNKISDSAKRADTYRVLCTLLEETEQMSFLLQLGTAIQQMLNDDRTHSFGVYFQTEYLESAEYWAYCYRQHLPVNMSKHLESIHKNIRTLYSQGKKNKRLDQNICALMEFIRDKLYGRLVSHIRGIVSTKLGAIRKRHNKSLESYAAIIKEVDEGWTVMSEKGLGIYDVKRNCSDCTCPLMCDPCETCIHAFNCTCPDSVMNWNMCNHIHLIASHLKNMQQPVYMDSDEYSESLGVCEEIVEEEIDHESIVEVIGKTDEEYDMEDKIANIRSQFDEIISMVNTPSQVSLLEKLIAPIIPTLKNSSHQTNFFSTENENKLSLKHKPSENEKWRIASSFILSDANLQDEAVIVYQSSDCNSSNSYI